MHAEKKQTIMRSDRHRTHILTDGALNLSSMKKRHTQRNGNHTDPKTTQTWRRKHAGVEKNEKKKETKNTTRNKEDKGMLENFGNKGVSSKIIGDEEARFKLSTCPLAI